MTGDLDWELLSAVFACFFASALGLVTLFNYFAENLDTTAAAGPTVLDPRLSMAKLALYFAAGLVVGVVLAVQLDMPLVGVLVFLGAGVMGVFHQKKAQNELRYAFFKFFFRRSFVITCISNHHLSNSTAKEFDIIFNIILSC